MNGLGLIPSIILLVLALTAIGAGWVFTITKAAANRAAQRESYALYRSVFEKSAAVMMLLDAETLAVVDANPAACDFYGYTLERMKTLKITDINTVDPTGVVHELKMAGTRTQSVFRFQHRKASGEARDVEVNTSPMCIGGRMFLYSIIVDVTERTRSEERFAAIFRYAPVMMAIVSMDERRFLDVNDAFLISMGVESRDIIGKTSTEVGIFPSVKDYMDVGALFEGSRQLRNVEVTMLWKDGRERTILISADSVRLNGRACWLASYTDITERKAMELELLAAKEAAVKVNLAKSRVVANISHEVRTPMHGISGFLELLSRSELDGEQQDLLREARQASETLLRTMNGLLDYSRLESGMLRLEETPFQVRRVFQEAVSLFARSTDNEAVAWKLAIPEDVPDWVVGDPLRLQQVLHNLLSNAVKFTERGSIAVMAQVHYRDGDALKLGITVQDTGIGIAPEAIEAIFVPFTQADDTITRRYGGTGLGLTICRELVRLMGGSISVESKQGAGARFQFSVWLRKANEGQEAPLLAAEGGPSEEEGLHNSGGSLRILLVEDNEVNRRMAVKMLEQDCILCDEAPNGLEALRKLEEADYDLILMDCQMPVMDGFRAAEAIRSKETGGRRTPMIALTAQVSQQEMQACLAAGMDDLLGKPFSQQDLKRMIRKYARPSEITATESGSPYLDPWTSAINRIVRDCGLTEEQAAEMLGHFGIALLPQLQQLRRGLEQGGKEEGLGGILHALKGQSGTLRLHGLYRLLTDVEAAIKQDRSDYTKYTVWIDRYMGHLLDHTKEGLYAQHRVG